MAENLRLIKRVTKHKLKNDFDGIYDAIRVMALDKFDYEDEIRVIEDTKWVSFYIIGDGIIDDTEDTQ